MKSLYQNKFENICVFYLIMLGSDGSQGATCFHSIDYIEEKFNYLITDSENIECIKGYKYIKEIDGYKNLWKYSSLTDRQMCIMELIFNMKDISYMIDIMNIEKEFNLTIRIDDINNKHIHKILIENAENLYKNVENRADVKKMIRIFNIELLTS